MDIRRKLGFRSRLLLSQRLLLSHLIVMVVGLTALLVIGKFSSPRFFVIYLSRMESGAYSVAHIRTQLIRGFESAWTRGAFWSVVLGGTAAGSLSYWFSRRIVQPLEQMEEITQQFSSGQLDARVPASEILELNRLASSFNRMADELEDVERRRRDLVSDLSHELRTPLTILEGYLEGLTDGTIAPTTETYDRLTQETKRLKRLVNHLQELSKLEAGYFPIEARAINLCGLLHHVTQRFTDQLVAEDSPTLQLDCSETNVPEVLADPERVEQVLINLVGNAVQHTPSGKITVRAVPDKRMVWVEVQDTGEGIPPESLPHVFERFWRADRSRNRHSGGAGLGLAISKRLVELQGGQIKVDSILHEGSTFSFSLPIA